MTAIFSRIFHDRGNPVKADTAMKKTSRVSLALEPSQLVVSSSTWHVAAVA